MDDEIPEFTDEQRASVAVLARERVEAVSRLADRLLEEPTMDRKQLAAIVAGIMLEGANGDEALAGARIRQMIDEAARILRLVDDMMGQS